MRSRKSGGSSRLEWAQYPLPSVQISVESHERLLGGFQC